MVPVKNEKNVRPMNSTHIEKIYSYVVLPVISPYPTVVIVVRMK
jgi:hypothetical protein